ncbi:MAG: hypothetical protein CMN76_17560 [Spirochaetaceae bacterium]|nr:hypothetical protein [Spirochaetaceae bacterium]|tara:strand:- start:49909 stop:51015 length:1107 start_codon:yes stop_codon:yes gene_type:complete
MSDSLDRLFKKFTEKKAVHSALLRIEAENGDVIWSGAYGNDSPEGRLMDPGHSYFIASATKIFTAVSVLKLHESGKLDLSTPAISILPELTEIHNYKGVDHTDEIRVFHLLSHTSGLPDYFEQAGTGKDSLLTQLLNGGDRSWDTEFVLQRARSMKPPFPPATKEGSKNKAHYSDTNYQILDLLIERITGQSPVEALASLADSLGLRRTYMYDHSNAAEAGADQAGDTDEPVKPVPCLFYYGNRCLAMPQAMRSFRGDGAAVSTTADQIRFLRSLFLEGLLRPETLERMQQWNRIFFPFRYGMGLMQFQLPAILTGFRRMPEFIGHSGASGAINFYCPERKVFVAGTFNQLKDRSLPFQWMARAVGLL